MPPPEGPRNTFRVVAYVDTPDDLERARRIFGEMGDDQNLSFSDGAAEGWASSEMIRELCTEGLVVDSVVPHHEAGPEQQPDLGETTQHFRFRGWSRSHAGRVAVDFARGVLDSGRTFLARHVPFGISWTWGTEGGEVGEAGKIPAAQGKNAYFLRIPGTLDPMMRQVLDERGVKILSFQPPDLYRVVLTSDQRDDLDALPFVAEVRPYEVADTLGPDIASLMQEYRESRRAAQAFSASPQTYDVVLHREEDLPAVLQALKDMAEVRVLSAGAVQLQAELPATPAALTAVAELPEVQKIDVHREGRLFSDYLRRSTGLQLANDLGLDGANQVVAVFDSGIDTDHPDFTDRIIYSGPAAPGAVVADRLGHGTHVAGIIAGTGAASGGVIRGGAPEAKLAIFGVADNQGNLLTGSDLETLLARALAHDAKIINLSWGTPIHGIYDVGALSLDRFVYRHPDVLVVVAAGNEGSAPEGDHKFATLGSPASAKNAITVGSCGTDRQLTTETWGKFRADRFPRPAASNEPLCGSLDTPAALSSRGPTDFDTVKPDVLSPGIFVLAPRSSKINPKLVWRAFADDPDPAYTALDSAIKSRYVYFGGTSMAAAAVSAAGAVLRQYIVERRAIPNPSAALLKAILIASVRRMEAVARTPVHEIGYPDFDQGHGRVDLANILPCPKAPRRRLMAVDVANDSPDALEARAPSGGSRRQFRTYLARVADEPTEPLRVVLATTDPPGNSLQNNLQLDLRGPENLVIVGNPEHRFRRDSTFDRAGVDGVPFDKRNNVKQIFISMPRAGAYRIRAIAQNTPLAPQGYALCVCGELVGDLEILGQ